MSQPPKGTGTGTNVLTLNYTSVANSIITVTIPAVGSYIQGNVDVAPGSVFNIGGNIYNTLYVAGTVNAGFTPGFCNRLNGWLVISPHGQQGTPAPLTQTTISQFAGLPATGPNTGYVTALGGFSLSRQRSELQSTDNGLARHGILQRRAGSFFRVTPPSHPTNKSTVLTDCRAIRSERIGRRPAIGTSRFVPGSPRNGRGGRMRPEPHFAESRIHEPVCTNSSPLVRFARPRHRSPQVSS